MADGGEPLPPDWWAAWPELLATELEAFGARGATANVAHQAAGLLILDVVWPQGEGGLRLTVGFSPLHPFARPVVVAPDLRLGRHQHPLDQGLCLLTQSAGEWRSCQKVADFIAEQLPKVLAVDAAREAERFDEAALLEERAPDPLSPYYDHLAEEDSAIFFAGDRRAPSGDAGFARFEIAPRPMAPSAFEAVLRGLQPMSGKWLAKPFDLPLGGGRPTTLIEGRWVRLRPPATDDPAQILAAAEAAIEKAVALRPAEQARFKALGAAPQTITGLVFDEELAYAPGGAGEGWLFVASATDAATGRRRHSLIRGFRIADDLQARVPVASKLAGKKALVVGVGAIGGFAALELARAGVGGLHIVDLDVVEPGNSVRWPLGRPAWGVRKVVALKDFIERNYPLTRVCASQVRIGAATSDGSSLPRGFHPLAVLLEFVREADVVIDASASTECQEALAHYCREVGKPLVIGYATEGAAGGVVARFPTGCAACFVCLQEHWREPDFPNPAVDASGTVIPIGCNHPTFTGASFDLQEVSLELVRSAVGLMAPAAYDPGDWQVAILSLCEDGKRRPPRWETASLNPKCHGCART